jgi:eukaryotic-like serine/threonine-protein kinase
MTGDHGEVSGREVDRDRDQDRERRLFEILAAYFEAAEAGEVPDRSEWLARYPDLAKEIVKFLEDQDRLLKLTEPLRPVAEQEESEGSARDPAGESGALTAGLRSEGSPPTEPTSGAVAYAAGTKVRYIGDYELLGEIARGGMGVVFRARQRSLNRPVALKMLLAGSLVSNEDEQRFRQEAEAAANLDHPNIVPIFEVGRHDGHSYFSMKLVDGGSLAQRLPDVSTDQKAAARLMALVARAVHHAHQRGVLHRDLKPSNILLSGGPDTPAGQLDPHVTDFGLAKRVDGDPGLTQSGAILGTPSYMAPEQAIGKKGTVTVATDVYGLGAVVYAMLSGRPPFQGDSVLETLAQVKDRALDPPSSRGRRVDRDLETICLKCLEKEPGRRYRSAEAVAEDLERWMAGVPILARPAGRAERAWRWCRRNPLVAALTAAVAVSLTVTLAGLIVSNRVIARKQAEVEAQRDEARQAVDDMYSNVAEQWLAQQAALEPMQHKFLQKAVDYYQKFASEANTDPAIRFKSAVAHRRVGAIQEKLGNSVEARDACRRSIKILATLLAEESGVRAYERELAVSKETLARLLWETGSRAQAEALMLGAVALLEKAAAGASSDSEYQRELARCYNNLARLLRGVNAPEAERALRRAIVLTEGLAANSPAVPQYLRSLGIAHNNLGLMVCDLGRPAEAEPIYRRAIKYYEELAAALPFAPENKMLLGSSLDNLAQFLTDTDRVSEVERLFRRAIELEERAAADSPSVPDYRKRLALTLGNLGALLSDIGRQLEAEPMLRRAVALLEELVSGSPRSVDTGCFIAGSQKNLALSLERADRPLDAEQEYRRAIALAEKLAAAFPSISAPQIALVDCEYTFATFLQRIGRTVDADREYRRAVTLLERRPDAEMQDALAWVRAAAPDPRLRDPRLAVGLAAQAVAQSPRSNKYWRTLGVARYRAGDWKAAIEALERSAELCGSRAPADQFFLAMAHWQQGDKNKACSWYDDAVQRMEKNRPRDGELRRFRDEAEVLLGVADSRMPNGSDAFRKE